MSRDSHGNVTRAHNVTGEFWGGLPKGRTYSPPREGGERAGLVTLRSVASALHCNGGDFPGEGGRAAAEDTGAAGKPMYIIFAPDRD